MSIHGNALALWQWMHWPNFLGRFAPFQGAEAADLERLAQASTTETFAAGDTILLEDGAPARRFA